MNSQLFFLLNLVFGALFLGWFLMSRKGGVSKPTRLKMKSERESELSSSQASSFSRPAPRVVPSWRAPDLERVERELKSRQEKTLNVLFLYNGHDWDAYQVLGLPAGAGLPMVTQRYQELIRHADQGQLDFYEAAYRAILAKR